MCNAVNIFQNGGKNGLSLLLYHHRYISNSQNDQLPVGLITQVVEHLVNSGYKIPFPKMFGNLNFQLNNPVTFWTLGLVSFVLL